MLSTNTERTARHAKRHRWVLYAQILEECDRLPGIKPLALLDRVRLGYHQLDGMLRILHGRGFLEILEYEQKKHMSRDFEQVKTLRTTQKGRVLLECIQKLQELMA